MHSTRRSEYWEVKSEKISPQNIFPLVDTFPPNAMPFSFIMQREYFPQAVIAVSVPINHNGCKITSQNHFIARDHNFTCSTYNSQNQMIEQLVYRIGRYNYLPSKKHFLWKNRAISAQLPFGRHFKGDGVQFDFMTLI